MSLISKKKNNSQIRCACIISNLCNLVAVSIVETVTVATSMKHSEYAHFSKKYIKRMQENKKDHQI